MPTYTQANRPLKVKTALADDELLLLGFTGREAVSRTFAFQLELMSENKSIDAQALLRKSAVVTIRLHDDSERYIHGLVSRFTQLGSRDEFAFYRAEIVPWLWFLSLTRDCRIFQNKSVLDIIEQIFKDQGYSDYEIKCTKNYPKREYCVQYRESHFDFVTRLMEDEGIFYYFDHSDSKHVMVLADVNSSMPACPGPGTVRVAQHARLDEDIITEMQTEDAVYIGKVTLRDYDPLQPTLNLNSVLSGNGKGEIYDYQPVIYTGVSEGERYARVLLEAEEAQRKLVRGKGSCRFFVSGCRFELSEHYRADLNRKYAILQVDHEARTGDYRSWDDAKFDHKIEFAAIPDDLPYRALRSVAQPRMPGSQTAVVVGKSGEEIWTDKHGRVKVQFHWDREGKKDENSSCWVRVSSSWAGKNWGAVQIPRIGQEVIVDFIEGDPDRPIITGRVYNADQTPPYKLPDNQTQSGVKSRSSKQGGADDFNEIRFEDKKDAELLYVHAQKDKNVIVENDRTEEVGHDEKITIKNDRTEEVKGNEKITIEKDRTEDVKGNEKITIVKERTEEVKGGETVKVHKDRKHEILSNETVKVSSKRAVSVGADDKLEVGAKLTIEAQSDISVKSSGGKIVLESPTSIELKVGGSTIKLTPASIELKSPQIKIKGDAQVEVKAPLIKGKADAMLELQGAMTQVKGDGIIIVKGGIAMIN